MLQSFTYTLDANGNRLSKQLADKTFESYKYDPINRLTEVDNQTGGWTQYALNAYGQITRISPYSPTTGIGTATANTFNSFNQLTQQTIGSAVTNFTYDGNGNLTLASPSGGTSTVYKYDGDNRMTEVDLPGGGVDTYAYDANGLRIAKSDSSGMTHYLLDGPSVVSEYDGTSTLTEQHNNNPQRIDEQLDLVQGGTKLWPVTDGLGSVYEWVDRSGNVVGSYSYDVYGSRTQTSGSVNVAWGYTGREHDTDTGLNYNRDRYLAPGLAVWTQADRLAEDGAPVPNEYAYVSENPAGFTDPTGEYSFPTTPDPGNADLVPMWFRTLTFADGSIHRIKELRDRVRESADMAEDAMLGNLFNEELLENAPPCMTRTILDLGPLEVIMFMHRLQIYYLANTPGDAALSDVNPMVDSFAMGIDEGPFVWTNSNGAPTSWNDNPLWGLEAIVHESIHLMFSEQHGKLANGNTNKMDWIYRTGKEVAAGYLMSDLR